MRRVVAILLFALPVFGADFLVTNTNDDGPGSLRQAIVDVNRNCREQSSNCAVVFHIEEPVPAEGWFTIRPQTPLPVITSGQVTIDGTTQTLFSGDTNPEGPEIALDGSEVTEGSGLMLRGSLVFGLPFGIAYLKNLSIGNFPASGIETHGGSYLYITACYLGVDPTGFRAAPNGLRGIHVEDTLRTFVNDGMLSGNRRSGGWFWTDGAVEVARNQIGTARDGYTPMGNGASGLFFHKPRVSFHNASVAANAIANNAHAGIAVSRTATGSFGRNVFRDNGGEPIDIGLDGRTLEVTHGYPGQGGIVGAPTITSARVENGATIIEGRIAPVSNLIRLGGAVEVYRSASEDREADEFLGSVVPLPSGNFTFRVQRDLHGDWVRASTYFVYIFNWDDPAAGTSELGVPMRVE